MPDHIQDMLLNYSLLLLAIFFIAYIIGRSYSRKRYRFDRKTFYSNTRLHTPSSRPDLSDPNVAIQYVQASQYSVRTLMNKNAFSVFKITEYFFRGLNQGHRVIPEICLGAVLYCSNREGFSSINSKRIDIGVVDWTGNLILAIEYNGTGHYQGNAPGRDAVKRLALNKAQVPLIEIIPDDDEARIVEKIRTAIAVKN